MTDSWLGAFVDGVVGLVAPGGVEGWVERGGGGGAEFEVVLEWVGGGGVGGGDDGGEGCVAVLHGGGEPAFAVVDVTVPEGGVPNLGRSGYCESEVGALMEG